MSDLVKIMDDDYECDQCGKPAHYWSKELDAYLCSESCWDKLWQQEVSNDEMIYQNGEPCCYFEGPHCEECDEILREERDAFRHILLQEMEENMEE